VECRRHPPRVLSLLLHQEWGAANCSAHFRYGRLRLIAIRVGAGSHLEKIPVFHRVTVQARGFEGGEQFVGGGLSGNGADLNAVALARRCCGRRRFRGIGSLGALGRDSAGAAPLVKLELVSDFDVAARRGKAGSYPATPICRFRVSNAARAAQKAAVGISGLCG
jgi:hypothetical protein